MLISHHLAVTSLSPFGVFMCCYLEPGGREQWLAGDSRYDAALQELGAKVCREEERKIYDLVFKLKLLRDDKAQESGNAATKILRRIIKLRW